MPSLHRSREDRHLCAFRAHRVGIEAAGDDAATFTLPQHVTGDGEKEGGLIADALHLPRPESRNRRAIHNIAEDAVIQAGAIATPLAPGMAYIPLPPTPGAPSMARARSSSSPSAVTCTNTCLFST